MGFVKSPRRRDLRGRRRRRCVLRVLDSCSVREVDQWRCALKRSSRRPLSWSSCAAMSAWFDRSSRCFRAIVTASGAAAACRVQRACRMQDCVFLKACSSCRVRINARFVSVQESVLPPCTALWGVVIAIPLLGRSSPGRTDLSTVWGTTQWFITVGHRARVADYSFMAAKLPPAASPSPARW